MSDDKPNTNIDDVSSVDHESSHSEEGKSLQRDDRYPLTVLYCGVTGLPFEYCEFSPKYAESKIWWKENHPEIFEQYGQNVEDVQEVEKTEKKEEKPKQGNKSKKEVEKEVIISSVSRTKKKFVTSIKGLGHFNIKLPEACKLFSKKFAASASAQKKHDGDEIIIQGDIVYKIAEFIAEKWGKELDLNKVFVLEEGKKIPVTKLIDE